MSKREELEQTIGTLHEKLIASVAVLSGIPPGDERQPGAVDAREELVDSLVAALKELKLLDATPCATELLTVPFKEVTQHMVADETVQVRAEPVAGDKGQRYEVSCIDEKGAKHIVGWDDADLGVLAMVLVVLRHPSFHGPSVIDRQAESAAPKLEKRKRSVAVLSVKSKGGKDYGRG